MKKIVDKFGTVCYLLNDKLHREDGPAVEYVDGNKYWYKNNKMHKEDGPAIEYDNGGKYSFISGKRHREDGPAVEIDEYKEWWIEGVEAGKITFK